MSEEQRYNDEQWADLPLPDGETAWQKMELLLDKEEKRRRVLPFWFWRYAGPGLLAVGMAVGGWLWFGGNEKENETIQTATTHHQKQPVEELDTKNTDTKSIIKPDGRATDKVVSKKTDDPEKNSLPQQPFPAKKQKNASGKMQVKKRESTKDRSASPPLGNTPADLQDELLSEKNKAGEKVLVLIRPNEIDSIKKTIAPKKDSIATKDTTTTKVAEPIANNEQKKEAQNKGSAFMLSAGVGLQQAIALDGQQSSAYNYNGKRNSFSDRIPSLYLRLQKGAWFAQAEFQYAVPQPVQQFSFSQKTRYDAASLNLNTEQLSIQKLYYHQLPFSINYQIMPNWSIGTGVMYNILAGAVSEQEIRSKNVQSGAETISRNITPVKGYKDSFLYKTTAGVLLQTDYHWKRFSLGLRYTQNLEPFIKYTKPDGEVLNEKNKVLQAVLRFRLWRYQ